MAGLGPNLWPKVTSIWNTHRVGLDEGEQAMDTDDHQSWLVERGNSSRGL